VNNAGEPTAPKPFGRIYNNTIYGLNQTGVGIQVTNNASPTLLNNVLANLDLGIDIDQSSSTTVVGGSLYKGNVTTISPGHPEDYGIELTATDPLFVDASRNNFYPAAGTNLNPNFAIDSSIGSLQERFEFGVIKTPIGIGLSPIIAPITDVTGQLRVDDPDVEPPFGVGTNVFIDRGAVDRSDFTGPRAIMLSPRDNDADELDENTGVSVIKLSADAVVPYFDIRLNDGEGISEAKEGIGIFDDSVSDRQEKVIVRRDGILLRDKIHYSFSYNTTNDTIRLTPLAGIWPQDSVYTISLVNSNQWTVVAPHGNEIDDADVFTIFDLSFQYDPLNPADLTKGGYTEFAFERGFTLNVVQTAELKVPEEGSGPGGIQYGEFFTIVNTTSGQITFEFHAPGQNITPGRTGIEFPSGATPDQIAIAIRDAISDVNLPVQLGLSPVVLSEGRIHLGTQTFHQVNGIGTTAPALSLSGQYGGVADGDLFWIDDFSKRIEFEFEDTEIGDGVDPNFPERIAIPFNRSQVHQEIAQTVVDTIIAADLGLTPRHFGNGEIYIGGSINHDILIVTSVSGVTILTGEPGVRPELTLEIPTVAGNPQLGPGGGLEDATTFTIQLGATPPVTFELNNRDVNPSFDVASGNKNIDFTSSSTVEEIAQTIAQELRISGLGLDPDWVPGTARIKLGANSNHQITSNNTKLRQLGNSQKPAQIPVNIQPVPEFDGTQVAVAMLKAINGETGLVGVKARANGGAEIIITGAMDPLPTAAESCYVGSTPACSFPIGVGAAVNDLSGNFKLVPSGDGLNDVQTPRFIRPIRDKADNTLKPNQLSGETKFTIVLGEVARDFSDAPDGVGLVPQSSYPVLTGHDAAVHMVTADQIYLGERIDTEEDGQSLFIQVTGDGASLNDGEQFTITAGGQFAVFEFERADVEIGVIAEAYPIDVLPGDSAEVVAEKIVATILNSPIELNPVHAGQGKVLFGSNSLLDVSASPTNLSVVDTFALGDDLDGDNYVVDTTNAGVTTSEGPQGTTSLSILVAQTLTLTVPQTLQLILPSGGDDLASDDPGYAAASGLSDGLTFDVSNGPTSVIFELEDADIGNGVDTGHTEIAFDATSSLDNIAEAIVAALSDAGLDLAPKNLGNGAIHLGSVATHALNTDDTVITKSGQPGGVTDEENFTVINTADPSNPVTFEFDDDTPSDFDLLNESITFDPGQTNDEIAAAIVTALDGAGLGLQPKTLPDGQVHLGSTANHTLNVDFAPNITKSGQAGNVADGDSFSVTQLATTVVFEFEDRDLADGTSFSSFAVPFSAADTHEEIAASMTTAIQNAQNDVISLNLNPIDRGNGEVELDGDDEDGVTGLTGGPIGDLNPYVTTVLEVTAFKDSLLDAWIDFNRDGDWDDPHEQIFSSKQLLAGINQLEVTPPLAPDTIPGLTYARFRVSSTGGLLPTGLAADGEVEDYSILIVPGTPPEAIDDPTNSSNASLFIISEDALLVGPSLLANDVDVDGDPFQVSSFDNPSQFGAIVVVDLGLNTDPVNGNFTYDPRNAAQLQELVVGDELFDTFTYMLREQSSHNFESLAPATVTILVQGANDVPTVEDVSLNANEDGLTVAGSFVGDDLDRDNELADLEYTIVVDLLTGDGEVTNNLDGTFTFDPKAGVDFQQLAKDETLDVTFTYKATDRHGAESLPAIVTITVTGVNDDPVAEDDLYVIAQNLQLIADDEDGTQTPSNDNDNGVMANDFDVDNGDDPVVSELESSASNLNTNFITARGATINLQADGTFVYDPTFSEELRELAPGESRLDQFTYTIKDSLDRPDGAFIKITVQGVNDNPEANDDTYEVDQDETLTVSEQNGLRANDTDPDNNDSISIVEIIDGATNLGGTVNVQTDGSFVYEPTGAFLQGLDRGVDTVPPDFFTYTLVDGLGATDTATVEITVHGVNKNPVANPDAYGTDEDTTLFVITSDGLILGVGADSDPENDTLNVTGINDTSVRSGESTMGAYVDITPAGSLTYNPKHDPNGEIQQLNVGDIANDTFTYTISDGNGGTDSTTVTITLTGINDAPVAADDWAFVRRSTDIQNTSVNIKVVAGQQDSNGVMVGKDTDVDGTVDESTIVVTVEPSVGTATAKPDGTIDYQPLLDWSGVVEFKYAVRDNSSELSEEVTVTVVVNDPPDAIDDAVTAILDAQNASSTFDILANDTDTEGGTDPGPQDQGIDAATVVIVQQPTKGVATVQPNGTVVYLPNSTLTVPPNEEDIFTYTVRDSSTPDNWPEDLPDGSVSNIATVTINIIDDEFPWQNKVAPDPLSQMVRDRLGEENEIFPSFDINADGVTSPEDALIILTYMRNHPEIPRPTPLPPDVPPPYYDTTGDGIISDADYLYVVDELNRLAEDGLSSGEGEGESLMQYWQQESISQLDVGIVPSTLKRISGLQTPLTVTGSDGPQAENSAVESSQAVIGDNSQYQAVTVANSNRRAEGLKIADSESLEDLLDVIADDLAGSAESSVHGSAIEQWFSRYLDN
jgi:VCBS repeat-containing protein